VPLDLWTQAVGEKAVFEYWRLAWILACKAVLITMSDCVARAGDTIMWRHMHATVTMHR